jgi:hypothetical protein
MDLHKYVVRADSYNLSGVVLRLAHPDYVAQTTFSWLMIGRVNLLQRSAGTSDTLFLMPLRAQKGKPSWATFRTALCMSRGVPPPGKLEEHAEVLFTRQDPWTAVEDNDRSLKLLAWATDAAVSADTRWSLREPRSRAPLLLQLLAPNERPRPEAPTPSTTSSDRENLDERAWRRELRALPAMFNVPPPLNSHKWDGGFRAGSVIPWGALSASPVGVTVSLGTTNYSSDATSLTSPHWRNVGTKAKLDLLMDIEFGAKKKEEKRRRVYSAWLQPAGSAQWENLPLPLQNLLATGQAPQGTPEPTTGKRRKR